MAASNRGDRRIMTRQRRTRTATAARATGLALLAAACAAGVALAAGPTDQLYERTLMTAANSRCRLFEPALAAALDASRLQARGAALRAGATNEQLWTIENRARQRAAASPCGSPDLRTAANRVRSAFEGYARLTRLTWSGDIADWRGDRTITRQGALWRLSQTSSFGADRLIFGLAGEQTPGSLQAAVAFADGRTPYAARIVMRDTARAAQPYLDKRRADRTGRLPLSARVPPASALRAFTAEGRADASERLRPTGTKSALLYRFPGRAADAMAALDPREAVIVEFVFQGRKGDEIRRAYVEVGDFAAGRAFLAVPAR